MSYKLITQTDNQKIKLLLNHLTVRKRLAKEVIVQGDF